MAELPIVEKLRGATLGLCSEDARGYVPRGVNAQDCSEAADTIAALYEALRSAVGAMEVLGHPADYGALAKANAALSLALGEKQGG